MYLILKNVFHRGDGVGCAAAQLLFGYYYVLVKNQFRPKTFEFIKKMHNHNLVVSDAPDSDF